MSARAATIAAVLGLLFALASLMAGARVAQGAARVYSPPSQPASQLDGFGLDRAAIGPNDRDPYVPDHGSDQASACHRILRRDSCTRQEMISACVSQVLADSHSECEQYVDEQIHPPGCYATGPPAPGGPDGQIDSTQRVPCSSVGAGRGERNDTSDDDEGDQAGDDRQDSSGATGESGASDASGGEAAVPAVGSEDLAEGSDGDLLKDNGLISPWCKHPAGLTTIARENCKRTGSTATSAYGDQASWDIHIDTGVTKVSAVFSSAIQNTLRMVWVAFLWITRGAFFLVELALSFNPFELTGSPTTLQRLSGEIGAITRPLALLLAPAGAGWILLQFGIAKREGEAIKQVGASALLITGCLVVLQNPLGTVGGLLTSSQQIGTAIIGTVTDPITPGHGTAAQNTQSALGSMTDSMIDQPLALLEFGDVAYGTDPDQLDPELKKAAVKLAQDDKDHPDRLQRAKAARTNLQLFMLWPAGSSERNAINEDGSLYRVMCGTDDDQKCKGPAAEQAEFRTEKGTWQRGAGMLLILAGLVPVWIALIFCAVKILEASLMLLVRTIQLLFVAPLAVLGGPGNARVSSYLGSMIGHLVAATAYSSLLSLIFLVWEVFTQARALGFVGQWLLLAVTLLLIIRHHHTLWGVASGGNQAAHSAGMRVAGALLGQQVAAAGIRGAAGAPGSAVGGARQIAGRVGRAGIALSDRSNRSASTRARELHRPAAETPATSGLESAGAQAVGAVAGAAGAVAPAVAAAGAPLVGAALAAAPAMASAGDAARRVSVSKPGGAEPGGARSGRAPAANDPERERRAAWAAIRGQEAALAKTAHQADFERVSALPDVQAQAARRKERADETRDALAQARRTEGPALGRAQRQHASAERRFAHSARRELSLQRTQTRLDGPRDLKRERSQAGRYLDRQAAKPAGQRNYRQLAGLAGSTPAQYDSQGPQAQRELRARIDRDLGTRTAAREVLKRPAAARPPADNSPAPRRPGAPIPAGDGRSAARRAAAQPERAPQRRQAAG